MNPTNPDDLDAEDELCLVPGWAAWTMVLACAAGVGIAFGCAAWRWLA